MKPFLLLSALLSSLPLACAQSSPTPSIATKVCGPDQVNFAVRTEDSPQPALQPEPGKALVFVISQVWKPVRVGMDGNWIGSNAGHSYTSISVNSGEHHFCVEGKFFLGSKGKQVSLTSFVAEPDKTYFLRARLVPTWRGDANASKLFDLDLINADQGKYLLETLPYSVSRPKK